MRPRLRCALAGATGALVWAAAEPLDRRLFRFPYSDVALLGKAVTRGRPGWRAAGLAVHALNGAAAGVAFWELNRRARLPRLQAALAFAAAEHLATYPLTAITDRHHPARGDADLPRLWFAPRGFAQATFRHALFGLVLGGLAAPAPERSPARLRA